MNLLINREIKETISNHKLFFYKNNKCIIVPNHMKYWCNYDLTKYCEYCDRKFVFNLKNIGQN